MPRSTPETRAARFVSAWQAVDRAARARLNADREFEAAARAIAERDGVAFIDGLEMRDPLYQYEPGCAPKSADREIFPHLNREA